jgi:hypothetical protein
MWKLCPDISNSKPKRNWREPVEAKEMAPHLGTEKDWLHAK